MRSETGAARRVAALIEPALEAIGLRLVRVRMTGPGGRTLQVMAEHADGTMSVGDCEAASRAISPLLDVEDPLPGGYFLEVSSPGIDRPLVRPSDFERWRGHEARIDLAEPIEGRRRFRGVLEGFDAGEVCLWFEAEPGTLPVLLGLPAARIAEARLVPSGPSPRAAAPARRREAAQPPRLDRGRDNWSASNG